jgi:hypothetical protein
MGTYLNEGVDTANARRREMVRAAWISCIYFLAAFLLCCALFALVFAMMWFEYSDALSTGAGAGMAPANGLGQTFAAADLQDLARGMAVQTYGETMVSECPALIENVKVTILSNYTLNGTIYSYDKMPVFLGWPFLGLSVWFALIAIMHIYALLRVRWAGPREYCTIIVLMFLSLDTPAAILLICGCGGILDSRKPPISRKR